MARAAASKGRVCTAYLLQKTGAQQGDHDRFLQGISEATGLPVVVAEDPLNCVAKGAGRALEDLEYRGVLHTV